MLGVQPMLGRLFSQKDDEPGGQETVILTSGYWQSRFGGDRSAIGRMVMLDSRPREIIGVLPDTFRFLDRNVSLVVPYRFDRSKVFLGQFSFAAIARLKPGATIAQATADVARMIPISLTRFPPFPGGSVKMFEEVHLSPVVRSLKDDLVGDVRKILWVLMGTIGIVLLIACANVANLLLVRAESRQQELAIRAALGAGSARIARELLLESVAARRRSAACRDSRLAFARAAAAGGAGAGEPAADRGHHDRRARPASSRSRCRSSPVCCSARSPCSSTATAQLGTMLRGGGRTASASKDRHRARNTLVVAQIALALVLLVSSGLMIRTFQALRDVNPGFVRASEVQTLRLGIPDSQVKEDAAVARMHQAIMDRIAAVPGVTSVALASTVTMTGDGWNDPLYAQDRTYAESKVPPLRLFKFVSPGYMKTMGGSLIAGRDFTWSDAYEICTWSRWSPRAWRVSCGASRRLPSASVSVPMRRVPGAKWSALSATCETTG